MMTNDSLETRVAVLNNDVLEAAQKVAKQHAGLVEQGRQLYARFQALAAENAGKDPQLSRLLADIQTDIGYIFNAGNSLTSTRLAQILRDQAALKDSKKTKN
jgi:hypothetical protein